MSNARNISKADSRFVNATGDTISGIVNNESKVGIKVGSSPDTNLEVATRYSYQYPENMAIKVRNSESGYNNHMYLGSIGSSMLIDGARYYGGGAWLFEDSEASMIQMNNGATSFHARTGATAGGSSYSFPKVMDIDSAGRVTTPNQPFGYAVGTTSSTGSYSTYHIVDWLAASTLQGGMAFSNGGRFTVPVAGTYMVTMSLYSYENSGDTEHIAINLHKNGTQYAPFQWETDGSGHAGRVDLSLSTTWLVTCAANDYLELRLYCDAGQTMDFFKGVGNNYFGVYLLG